MIGSLAWRETSSDPALSPGPVSAATTLTHSQVKSFLIICLVISPLFPSSELKPVPSTSNMSQEVSSRGYNHFFIPPASLLSLFPLLIPPVISEPPVPFCPAGSVSSLELSAFPAFSHHLIPTLTCPPVPKPLISSHILYRQLSVSSLPDCCAFCIITQSTCWRTPDLYLDIIWIMCICIYLLKPAGVFWARCVSKRMLGRLKVNSRYAPGLCLLASLLWLCLPVCPLLINPALNYWHSKLCVTCFASSEPLYSPAPCSSPGCVSSFKIRALW